MKIRKIKATELSKNLQIGSVYTCGELPIHANAIGTIEYLDFWMREWEKGVYEVYALEEKGGETIRDVILHTTSFGVAEETRRVMRNYGYNTQPVERLEVSRE